MKKVKDIILREYKALLVLSGVQLVIFLIAIILDRVAPGCNLRLQFPDRVYDLLYLYPWQEELYSNLFLIFALVYPFFFLYRRMKEVLQAVFAVKGRDRQKTESGRMLMQGLGASVVHSLVCCLVLFLENVLFFMIEGNRLVLGLAAVFFFRLFWIGLIYMVIALFIAVCTEELESCEDINIVVLLLPYVMARMHSLIRFFADQVAASNKKISEPELVETWIRRLNALQALAPVTWCTPGIRYPVWYILFGVLLVLILGLAAVSIFMDVR